MSYAGKGVSFRYIHYLKYRGEDASSRESIQGVQLVLRRSVMAGFEEWLNLLEFPLTLSWFVVVSTPDFDSAGPVLQLAGR